MTSIHCIFFLISLSILSLIVLVFLRILDLINVPAKQKVFFLKLNITIILSAPLMFYLLRIFFLQELEISLPIQSIHETTRISQIMTDHKTISWLNYVILLYGIGFALMFSRILFSYFKARKQLFSSHQVYIQGRSAFLNHNINTPLSFGLPKARIYFPQDLSKWTPREVQIGLAHEAIHVEQNDCLWKLLSLIVEAILFFVPWIYYLHKRFVLEMEIDCDTKTCQETGASVHEYGNLLLAMVCASTGNFIFNNLTDSTLKRRFTAMKQKTQHSKILIWVLNTIVLVSGPIAIAMASGIAANKTELKITSKIFVDGKLVSRPVIISKENQKAIITISKTNNADQFLKVELIARNASNESNGAIEIDYDIHYKDGDENLFSKPKVIVRPNEEAKIHLASGSRHSYELDVIAERIAKN